MVTVTDRVELPARTRCVRPTGGAWAGSLPGGRGVCGAARVTVFVVVTLEVAAPDDELLEEPAPQPASATPATPARSSRVTRQP